MTEDEEANLRTILDDVAAIQGKTITIECADEPTNMDLIRKPVELDQPAEKTEKDRMERFFFGTTKS